MNAARSSAICALVVLTAMGAWAGCATASSLSSGPGGAGTGGGTTSTGAGAGTGTGAGGGADCPGGNRCGDICTNIVFDPLNCGKCGEACPEGTLCSGGKCGVGCYGGSTQCGEVCVDVDFDPKHCGACDKVCAADELCSAGQCSQVCLGGTINCENKCVDTQLDPANCGACGNACPMGEVCSMGTCALACLGGATACGQACVDTQNDPANCGGCGTACPPGQVCGQGACGLVCLGGTIKCGSVCVDAQNDPANCGACGIACTPGEACVQGTCGFCQPGFTQCNATCVDEATDPENCGGCGVVCPITQVCSAGACADSCAPGLSMCGQKCLDTQTDAANCGACGNACADGEMCQAGQCEACDTSTTDCDADGWLVADGDCCDKPGLCGAEPELVNPGAIEVVGNGLDDNCNGKTDLFDTEDTVACDGGLASDAQDPLDYARALGICRKTAEQPVQLQDKTWGLIDAQLLRADGSPLGDFGAVSIRSGFGSIAPAMTEGSSVIVMSSGLAADATQTMPGPNGGAPAGSNVSTTHVPSSLVDIGGAGQTHAVSDWYALPNPPLKDANALPDSPGCSIAATSEAQDSVMLYLRLRAPTNVRAFSFNSYFFSAEYPEFVCTTFNDQFIALVDTPNGTPKPIANPVDKNLMTYTQGGQQWPIGINIAKGTTLFSVCDAQATNPGCWDPDVSMSSCSLGATQLAGTGFEGGGINACSIGGGTYWLTTAGNVIPGDIVELRIAIWDVGDSAYDSLAVIDGFQWLTKATLPGTGN